MRSIPAFVFLLAVCGSCVPITSFGQNSEKIIFDVKDSTSGYYLAVPPDGPVKGALVLITSLRSPESLLPETMLHNAAFANGILTIVASMQGKLFADNAAVARINAILRHMSARFRVDSSRVALAGYSYAGNIALRYTELANQFPSQFPLHLRAVFTIDSPVDCFGLWHWCQREIKKNFFAGSVADGNILLDMMTKAYGAIQDHPEIYQQLTPFYRESDQPGNERFLSNTAVRVYYDTDIQWQLKNRRNSYYDTYMADGSEFISRLMLAGNEKAEFVTARPGMRSNGIRNPNALSIVDEIGCIQWLKKQLDIFDPISWVAPYKLDIPTGWRAARTRTPTPT